METIKNLLKPGAKDDDKTLYDTGSDPNRGKVAGEGSHFSHSHSDSGVGGMHSPTSSTNPATGLTGSSATKTAEPTSATSAVSGGQAPIGTASTTTDDRSFPLSNTGTGSTTDPSSQAGVAGQDFNTTDRTAAGTVPAAAGTTAAAAAQPTTSSTTHTSTVGATQPSGIATSGIQEDTVHGGPHVTQIAPKIDPSYEDQSTAGVPSTIGSTSTTFQPTTTSTSHSEALAPGTGAATAGATGSSATKTADPVASTSHGSVVPAAVGAGAGAGLAGASSAGSQHISGQTSVDNHAGRTSASTATTVPTTASSGVAGSPAGTTASVAHPYSEKAVDPRIDSGSSQYKTLDPAADQRTAPVNKEQQHHYGRDAAVGGAAGAGAGALAGHEYSKKEAEQAAKDEKKAEKEHEKEVKQHQKEIEKAEKQHEKDLKKQEKEEKPGLIDRLLHRGDTKKENHNSEKAAAAGAATGAGAGAVHEHKKLHKDPPPGYSQEPSKGYASQVTGGTGTTALAQGNQDILPSGSTTGEPLPSSATVPGTRYGSGHDEHTASTATGGTSTQPEYYQNDPALGVKRDSVAAAGGTVHSTTPYLPAPQKGYASQVTGGTGTTQLAEGNLDPVTNPTKSNPLDQGKYGPLGYASTVTGGTGTTHLAQGTTTTVPTEGMAPGRSGSIAGVATSETPYVDGPKAGTGKYAEQVTGGTGTTQLAQGQLDEVANPRSQSIADKVEGALVMK